MYVPLPLFVTELLYGVHPVCRKKLPRQTVFRAGQPRSGMDDGPMRKEPHCQGGRVEGVVGRLRERKLCAYIRDVRIHTLPTVLCIAPLDQDDSLDQQIQYDLFLALNRHVSMVEVSANSRGASDDSP